MASLWHRSGIPLIVRQARRLVIFVVGATVVTIGVVMMIAPGPAFIVIPAGLAILATEFVWAQRLLKRVKAHAQDAYDMARRMTVGDTAAPSPGSEQPQAAAPPAAPPADPDDKRT